MVNLCFLDILNNKDLPQSIIDKNSINNNESVFPNKLQMNGFKVRYTHPNLLFISWQHYIPHYERAQIKRKTGMAVDSWGNVVKKKDKKNTSIDLNSLLLKNTPYGQKNIMVKKKDKKDYKAISSYKPTGNLIYNTKLLTRIENTVSDQNKKIN